MTILRHRLSLVALLCGIAVFAPLRSFGQTHADSGRAQFFQLRYADALASFERAVREDPQDIEARSWCAETLRRLGRPADALRMAREAIRGGGCSSLAHCVIAQAGPADDDTVCVHARAAIACDPSDPNPWLILCGVGLRQNDPVLHDSAITMMRTTGFFTPAALAWGRAELRTLPPDAVLITAGDMDTYPALAVQITEGFRTDVTVIEHEHAGIDWARRFYGQQKHLNFPRDEASLSGVNDPAAAQPDLPASAERAFRALLEARRQKSFPRPIALALTVDPQFLMSEREEFRLNGTYLLHVPGMHTAPPDTAALRECLDAIVPEEFRGSWTSTRDRSPVRRFYSDGLAGIIAELYGTYAGELTKAGRIAEANEVRRRAEAYDRVTTAPHH